MAPFIGQSTRRLEDARFLTGRGVFVDDVNDAGQAWAHRGPLAPRARQRSTASTPRRRAPCPGVLGIYTYRGHRRPGPAALRDPGRHRRADDRAAASGAGATAGCASSATRWRSSSPKPPAAARDAAEQVVVDYTPLPCVVDAAAALQPGCARRSGTPATNPIASSAAIQAAVQAAFAAAAHVVEIEVVNNRLVIAPMETRAAIGRWSDGVFDLFVSAASVHAIRDQLADSVFRCPRDTDPRLGARCRRRLRHQELPLSRMGHAALGRPPPRPPGQMGRGPRRGFRLRRAGPGQRLPRRAWRWMRTAASSRSMSAPSPAWAPTCRAAVPAVPPTPRPRRWAAATSSRRSSWTCAPPSPTPPRSTPIAAPASPRRTT